MIAAVDFLFVTHLQEPALGATKISARGGVEMVYVPAGSFKMGSDQGDEKPVRQVYLDGFYIGKNDVTVAQFRAYCDASGYKYEWEALKPKWGWKDDHPMVMVTWQESRDYCKWAGGDLPTEAQWEKAARGTDGRTYPWGETFATTKLWCSKATYEDAGSTAPIGSFPKGASPYGCLDMAGNVWQWCLDWKGDYDPDETKNPTGPGFGSDRVLRGGGWSYFYPVIFRCASRIGFVPGFRGSSRGFRLAGRL